MDVSSTSSLVNALNAGNTTRTQQAAQVMVFRKALDSQEANALAMLQAVPPAPQLATEGTLGTQVNTKA